jgi:exosome complex RNA-binding protein Csl4
MTLVRITPLLNRSEERMFECQKCSHIETRTVADPLKSEAVARLATNLRPPG